MMKKITCLLLCCMLLIVWNVSFAESLISLIEQSLFDATDDELIQAVSMIKDEQRSRLKTKIVLDPAEISLATGKTQKISAKINDVSEGVKAGKFIWSTGDASVATCQNGSVRGVAAGATEIVCSCMLSDGTEITAKCRVNVFVQAKSIKPKNKNATVMVSEYYVPEIEFQPEDTTNKILAYTSSDEGIIRVEEDGSLLAMKAGKAEITATTKDGSNKTARISVEVTRKLGKFDGEITFQGIEWGSDPNTVLAQLIESNVIQKRKWFSTSCGYGYIWPEDKESVLFGSFIENYTLRCVGDSPLKKFGGFMPNLICFQFLESVENGKIQEDNKELVAVAAEYNMYAAGLDEDTLHKTYYDAIFDLLSALETKYGEFKLSMNVSTVNNEYANHKFWGRDLYERAKAYNADLIEYELKGIGSRIAAVNFGNNNTGIALVTQESSYKILVIYGKTDAYMKLNEIREIQSQKSVEEAGF